MLPAGFGACTLCGRLLVVDSRNVTGHCTADCGGGVGNIQLPAPGPGDAEFAALIDEMVARWRPALEAMARWPEETHG